MKKISIYKISQSKLILNHGENLSSKCYKILGKGITNKIIENTGGDIFTSGPTISGLVKDADNFWNMYKVHSVGNYVMEGIESDEVDLFNKAGEDMLRTISQLCTPVRPYTHLAIKFTGLADIHMFTVWSKAQEILMIDMFRGHASEESDGL
jgi:hypothetical protein